MESCIRKDYLAPGDLIWHNRAVTWSSAIALPLASKCGNELIGPDRPVRLSPPLASLKPSLGGAFCGFPSPPPCRRRQRDSLLQALRALQNDYERR
jgi:hypothetical protein